MRDENHSYEEYTLFIIRETDAAIHVSSGDETELKPQFWLPKSELKSITRFAPEQNKWRMARVTIPAWLAERHDRDL